MKIQNIIKKTVEEFYDCNWGFRDFLTEDDVRCLLFSKLKQALSNHRQASVHAEVRWYGYSPTKLKYRTDLVIIDYGDIDTNGNNMFQLPSKGYSFDKFYAIIEIKLRRPNDSKSDNKFDETIMADIDKLKEISKNLNFPPNIFYYVLAFDKKGDRKRIISIHNDETNLKSWEGWNHRD